MIVKKTFSTLLMALPLMAVMTSCSDNDVAGNAGNSKSYIGFDVQTSRKTRGTVSVLGTLQAHKQFKTYSYNTGTSTWADYVDGGNLSQTGKSNPFENQVITYENGKAVIQREDITVCIETNVEPTIEKCWYSEEYGKEKETHKLCYPLNDNKLKTTIWIEKY